MHRSFLYPLLGFLAALTAYLLFQVLPTPKTVTFADTQQKLKEAEEAYKKGETAKSVAERKESFNRSLDAFQNLEEHYHPEFGNGKLYYNIANNLFQLEELPLSLYYYYKALQLAPRDPLTRENLALVLGKLHLAPSYSSPLSLQALTLSSSLSLPERLCLFFWIFALLFTTLSLFIWKRFRWLKPIIALLAFSTLFLLVSLFYTRFIAPQEGVLIRASSLYRDAGEQYAKATSEPLTAGLKVKVVIVRENGSWIKILTPDGSLGYVTSDAIKLL